MASPYKLKNAALLMALAAAYPLQAYAAAGTTLFTSGEVSVRRGTNADALAKGGNVESGDTILTGAQGRAQLRFSDGGLVALQPNSQFNISKYADANDPKQDAFLVDLLRGGMRAVTGLIGKRNRENYKVTTSTATIGIRGSSFLMSYQPDGTLVVSTEQDAIEVCTKAGCTGLTAGESVRVVSADREPVRTSTRASIPVPSPTRDPVIVGDSTKGTGSNGIVPNAPAPAPAASPAPAPVVAKDVGIRTGMAFVSAGLVPSTRAPITDSPSQSSANALDQRQYNTGTLVVDPATGVPSYYLAPNNDRVSSTAATTVVASSGSIAAGDLLILGTWANSAWTQGSGGVGAGTAAATLSNTAFATGVPTPTTALSSLSGMRGEYAFSAATPVYSTQGSVGTVLPTSKLSVDFLGAGMFADLSIDLRMPALAPTQPITVIGIGSSNSTDFNLRGGLSGIGASFSGGLYVSSAACVATDNNCGVGFANGFLSGPGGAKAGVSFTANNTAYGNFGGAATFAQSSKASTSTTTDVGLVATSQYLFTATSRFNSTSPQSYGTSGSTFYTGEGVGQYLTSAGFAGSQLTGIALAQASSSDFSFNKTAGAASSFGAAGKPGDADFIGWGAWAQGTGTGNGFGSGGSGGSGSGSSSQLIDFVHYIAGQPTPSNQMPTAGTASFGLVGGTAPTATLNGVTQTGQLVSGSLSVNFGTSSVGVNVGTKFGTTNVNVSANATINGSTFATNGCNGNTIINGIFTGNLAYRAGLVYQAPGTSVGTVNGAAAFQRTSGSGVGVGGGGGIINTGG